MLFWLFASLSLAQQEVLITLPSGGHVGLSIRGPTAFRVRFLFDNKTITPPINSPLIGPDQPDVPFKQTSTALGSGITSPIGSVVVSTTGVLSLLDAAGNVLTKSQPLGGTGDICSSQPSDVSSCTRVANPLTVNNQGECCDACKKIPACTNWIYGHPGTGEGNCWLIKDPQGIHPAPDRTLGGVGMGGGVSLSTNSSRLYGGGSGSGDANSLTLSSVSPHVLNRETYVSHYYTPDGYAALGVVNVTSGGDITRYFPASWNTDGSQINWVYTGPFELYLMPAASLDLGTRAYYALTGQPRVPPRYAFGFFASRWGWTDRAYIESILHQFRDGQYPIDSFISDFEWFTNESDYNFGSTGEPWYDDFGFNPVTFPDPAGQLKSYHEDLHFHMGGIRKPRLGNTATLAMAKAAGYLLPGGEFESKKLGYAEGRNLNYTAATRDWYAKQEAPLLAAGVDFFWNDEGETDYFTFHWWNVAQLATLRMTEATKRFFSINRAWSPGMARLGATVWTGDINPNWGDMQSTPGMVLNWGLAGGPYVACDIGGFTGETQADLLARWFQVGVFMPVMRVHSTESATPHFPFLWPEPYRSAMKLALNLRYQLLPYHYSLAHNMFNTGALWMRPLVFDFPGDAKAAGLTSQWLDGALLVAPVLTQDSNKNVYLPAGTWYVFNTSQTIQGPTTIQGAAQVDEIPVFTRPGAIITLAPVIQYADALPGGSLEVQVYAGANGVFTLVEDDGATTAYETGAVRTTNFKWSDSDLTLAWSVSGASEKVANTFSNLFVTLFTAQGVRKSAVTTIGSSGAINFK